MYVTSVVRVCGSGSKGRGARESRQRALGHPAGAVGPPRRADPYLGVKSMPGSSRRTNAAISLAAFWTSFMLTISLGECM